MVWSGKQALSSIESALNEVRDRGQQVDVEIQATSRELVQMRQEEAACYKSLAKIRLDQLVSGEIAADLDTAGGRVTELLGQRDQALAELQHKIDKSSQEQTVLEGERKKESAQMAQAAEVLDTREAEVQSKLQNNPEYQAQLDKARKADSVARQAEEKTAQAEADRSDKGKPYESDPLFYYLWNRGYGTSKYSANSITRFFDRWVARLCQYSKARPNYAMLLEIPKRLGEHAKRVRAAADQEFEALKVLEQKEAERGGVPALQSAVEEKERDLDKIDQQIQESEEALRGLMGQRATYASGEDDYFRRCIETLSTTFERENLSALYGYARATATAEDDTLVDELAHLNEKENRLEDGLAQHKEMYNRQLTRLKELEKVRRQFKEQRYDDIHSVFDNTDMLSVLIKQFLQGMASGNDLWGTIRRLQRYQPMRSNPVFGSGGLGRGGFGKGGVWRIPFPRGGGWGRFPRGGGSGSGGGFRTGGGF